MKQEVKSVVFKNFSEEEFVCSWDGTPYRFAAGKEMYVEDWKAEHFAKHLVDRVMHKKDLMTNNMAERNVFLALALPDADILNSDEAFDLEARKEAEEKEVEIKSEVTKKKASKKVVEEEFEGLKGKKK